MDRYPEILIGRMEVEVETQQSGSGWKRSNTIVFVAVRLFAFAISSFHRFIFIHYLELILEHLRVNPTAHALPDLTLPSIGSFKAIRMCFCAAC
jgi:hypothetical protein